MKRWIQAVALIALVPLIGCAGLQASAGIGPMSADKAGAGMTAISTTIQVVCRDEARKPKTMKGIVVTCESSVGIHEAVTNGDGIASFQVRGPLDCWADLDGASVPVTGAPSQNDTVSNMNRLVFDACQTKKE